MSKHRSKLPARLADWVTDRDAWLSRADEYETKYEHMKAQRDQLLAALNNLLDAVEALEGQSIEYPLAEELSTASQAASKAAIAAVGGSKRDASQRRASGQRKEVCRS